MSFEANIDKHIADLKKNLKTLEWQRSNLIHDCDCDYCDYQGDVTEDHQDEWDELTSQMAEVEAMIKRLENHAKLHRINV